MIKRMTTLSVALFLLLHGHALFAAPSHTLRAGFATVDITPPLGVDLLAFYQNRKATGVHDRLMAHGIVLEMDGRRIGIVAVDVCAVTLDFTEKVRQEVERATGIPGDRIMIGASHTHSGPATVKWLNLIGEMDENYMRDLHIRIAQALILAAQKLQPVTVLYGEASVEGVAANREFEGAPVDKTVRVLKFMRGNQVAGFMANYAVHPVVLGKKSPTLISGDLVAVADNKVLADYPGATSIFLQGCAGDQNPVECCSEDKTGLEKLERLSNILADRIREALRTATPVKVDGVDMEARSIALPTVPLDRSLVVLRLLDSERWLEKSGLPDDMRREFQFQEASARAVLQRYNGPLVTETVSQIQVARIGEVLILGNPGEPFFTLGTEEAGLLTGHKILVAGYTNDRDRYIPTPDRFDINVTPGLKKEGLGDSQYTYSFACYRVPWMAGEFPFRRDVGDVLVQAMVNLANDVIDKDGR